MGLAYFFLFVMTLGAAGTAAASLIAAREIWKKSRFKILAVILLLLAVLCAAAALSFLAIAWREPPWAFHF